MLVNNGLDKSNCKKKYTKVFILNIYSKLAFQFAHIKNVSFYGKINGLILSSLTFILSHAKFKSKKRTRKN